ncbi:hypothetical protein [Streptomyces shenzhenensis]|uniref:Dihydroorotate dehydrogenase electron transfer subunit iron-sulphur cluster binding domain-containing protein n=1 Tax=Streptomyces shenzhenensis TaxID=943815 RepID=A0A3M0I7C1_9ACTN|nr:hypothetical protein [Streptomyces shenzhenensis]RMB82673.1 hypothetical protein CTZ28_28415 [Streptomyces shenzhenensis]
MTRPRHQGPAREDGTVLLRTDFDHYTSIEVAAPRIARLIQPGQFVSVPAPPGFGPPGRWMLSPAAVRRDSGDASGLRLVARRSDNGPGALGQLHSGDLLALIGPLGSPFQLPAVAGITSIIGVDHGAAAALFVADSLREAGGPHQTHLFVPAPVDKHAAVWWDPVPRAAVSVEATPEPQRWTTRVARLAARAGQVVIIAPTPLARTAYEVCRARQVPCWVLLEPFMACGIGLCLTCAVPVAPGNTYARGCVDGPVFPGDQIAWQHLSPAGRPT